MQHKSTIHHNGNIHQLVEGLELVELTQGTITQELPKETDYLRFTVTGTDVHSGLRSPFKFAILATMRRNVRGALDLAYIRKLIDETVSDCLARENHFITGDASRGLQFDRAFARSILSPNHVACRLPNGRVISFDGLVRTEGMTPEEAIVATEGRLFFVNTGKGVYTYSLLEEAAKWGVNEIVQAKNDRPLPDNLGPMLMRHFVDIVKADVHLPVEIYQREGSTLVPLAVIKDQEELNMLLGVRSIKQPVASEYQEALANLDRSMSGGNVSRLPWRTSTGGMSAPGV